MKNNKILRKICKIFLIIVIIYNSIYVFASIFDFEQYLNFFGIRFLTMEDKSMLPKIGKNDLVIVKKYNKENPQTDDIVAYYKKEQLIIHKIILESRDKGLYVTKGENNYYQDDEKVGKEEIIGKMILEIPFLGIFLKIVRSKITSIIIVIYLILLYQYNKMVNAKRLKRREMKINNK